MNEKLHEHYFKNAEQSLDSFKFQSNCREKFPCPGPLSSERLY